VTAPTFDVDFEAEHLTAGLGGGPLREEQGESEQESGDAFERHVEALTAELLDTDSLGDIPTLQPLVDGFLYQNTLGRIIGPSGHMKSFVTLDFAGHVGTGQAWCGHKVVRGDVIYLVAEGAGGLLKRVRAWEQYHGRKMTGVKFLPRPVQAGDATAWSVLTEASRRLQPSLIIFDTQARITVGVEENSSKEMGQVVDRMEALRATTEACVLLVHHQGLNGDHGRGSTAVKGAMQTEIRVTKKGKKGPDARVIVSSDKQKDDEELDDVAFGIEVIKIDGMAKEDGSPVTSVVLVQADLPPGEGQQKAKLSPAAEKLLWAVNQCEMPTDNQGLVDLVAEHHGHGLRRETASRELNGLAKEGLIDRIDQGSGKAPLWSRIRTN
jgi:hypothetical protein